MSETADNFCFVSNIKLPPPLYALGEDRVSQNDFGSSSFVLASSDLTFCVCSLSLISSTIAPAEKFFFVLTILPLLESRGDG